jgi:hypothetical protein
MKQCLRIAVAALAVAFVVGGAVAQAQMASVNIDFPFVAAGKSMPAGKYTVTATGNGPVLLKGASGQVTLSVITRLGRHDKDAEPELVFDKLESGLHLSEVWMPGEDGYLLLGTKETHGHTVVGGPMGKKK